MFYNNKDNEPAMTFFFFCSLSKMFDCLKAFHDLRYVIKSTFTFIIYDCKYQNIIKPFLFAIFIINVLSDKLRP